MVFYRRNFYKGRKKKTISALRKPRKNRGGSSTKADIELHGRKDPFEDQPEFQGQGIGHSLVNYAFKWFTEMDIIEIVVITQGRNISAQRFYQKYGFVTKSLQLWYHKWFTQ